MFAIKCQYRSSLLWMPSYLFGVGRLGGRRHMYMHISIYTYIFIKKMYIYIYMERDREEHYHALDLEVIRRARSDVVQFPGSLGGGDVMLMARNLWQD